MNKTELVEAIASNTEMTNLEILKYVKEEKEQDVIQEQVKL